MKTSSPENRGKSTKPGERKKDEAKASTKSTETLNVSVSVLDVSRPQLLGMDMKIEKTISYKKNNPDAVIDAIMELILLGIRIKQEVANISEVVESEQ